MCSGNGIAALASGSFASAVGETDGMDHRVATVPVAGGYSVARWRVEWGKEALLGAGFIFFKSSSRAEKHFWWGEDFSLSPPYPLPAKCDL